VSGFYQRTDQVDHLVIDGESIVLFEEHFVRLGPLGTCIANVAESPKTIHELAAALTDAFGSPTNGSAVDATRAAIADLVAQGVLQEVEGD